MMKKSPAAPSKQNKSCKLDLQRTKWSHGSAFRESWATEAELGRAKGPAV